MQGVGRFGEWLCHGSLDVSNVLSSGCYLCWLLKIGSPLGSMALALIYMCMYFVFNAVSADALLYDFASWLVEVM